ncbi:Kelch motif family protein [Tritrichomonas foetus]|uniref:Kelch motif family protein n=1 Tax=Tritrichomonas foetus TaxID=1144522 RepID=A0A1J4L3P7_9EUKA|nr:Kelch motif family protein [Tritrichomonas foetus]|eukprot:OHT17688.1 Kelch motif family protein [Tritrichomonas foetus]
MGVEESAANEDQFTARAPGEFDDDDDDDGLFSAGESRSSKYSRIDGEKMQAFMEDNPLEDEDGGSIIRANITKMPYNGYWSIKVPTGKCPPPRTGHFTAYSDELRTCFVGYGQKRNGELLNDVWAFDVDDYKWTKLRLAGDPILPRAGCVATMMGNYIVVFGGEADQGRYFSELHTIDVTTGEVLIAEAKGSQPAPRRNPVMAIYRKRLYIWGGFNGSNLSELNVLDFASMKWGIVDTSIPGRPTGAWAVSKQRIFVYAGGDKTKDFAVVDMKNCNVSSVMSQGSPPNGKVQFAGMVKAGGYLLFFGGRSKSNFTMVFACELSTLWWFVFFVAPDGETTSLSDGKMSTDGVFELPRTDSFSSLYDAEKRQVMAFLGHPHKTPTPIFVLSVGQALSHLNLREDMMAMLEMSLDAYD